MEVPKQIRTPKQGQSIGRRSTPGSTYYAGYGEGFVEDLIDHLNLQPPDVLLDPWNGAGTTTRVALDRGLAAVGSDINPALVLIGKSKLLRGDATESLAALTAEVISRARRTTGKDPLDPLCEWFAPGTAAYFRAIEAAIQHLLVKPEGGVNLTTAAGLRDVSPLAASFYVVLFETVRGFLSSFTTTNPTWVKKRGEESRLSLTKNTVDAAFRAAEVRLHRRLEQLPLPQAREGSAAVVLADSRALPMDDSSADACITSPPYCTRIDYAVLTRPELAVLGVADGQHVRRLRDASIGTPTIWGDKPQPVPAWGSYTNELIGAISGHSSKASATYYRKYFVQYFDSMYASLRELRRVLRTDAPCALVVQDSFYKDIRVDLARSISEMAAGIGWGHVEQTDFAVPWNRARAHPGSRQYRDKSVATESLLILRG